jgi:hypothetical protein
MGTSSAATPPVVPENPNLLKSLTFSSVPLTLDEYLWSGWQAALALVQPRTVIAWQRKRFRDHWRRLGQQGTPGRPALIKEVRDLMRAMWQAHPTWGSPRIVGELRKLGLNVAKSTV